MKESNRKLLATLGAVLALIILGAVVVYTILLVSPPSALPIDAPESEFSGNRAWSHLKVIAREPHPIGTSAARDEVRDYLLAQVSSLGLDPQVQKTFGVRVVRPGFVLGGSVENVIVRLPGSQPDGAILLLSHYDSAPNCPAAVDSSSGVVTVLELLRAVQAGPALRQDVIFMFSPPV